MIEPQSTAEVEQLDADRARELTDQIAAALTVAWDKIVEAYRARVWVPLGYASWDSYCAIEFSSMRLRLPAEERAEVVQSLRAEGLSTRAIAAATGVSKSAVDREGATVPDGTVDSLDGRRRPASRPEPTEPERPADSSPAHRAAPRVQRRPGLVDQASSLGWALREHVDRADALLRDDRMSRHRDEVDRAIRSHLLHVADVVNQALGMLNVDVEVEQ